MSTKVRDLMKENPVTVAPNSTLFEAAQKMKSAECGALPVGTPEKLQGIITDRDIVIRAVAEGKDPKTEQVKSYMTSQIVFCDAGDSLEEAAELMREKQVNRLAVRDEANNKMCGILTFGCIIRKGNDLEEIGRVIERAVGKKAA